MFSFGLISSLIIMYLQWAMWIFGVDFCNSVPDYLTFESLVKKDYFFIAHNVCGVFVLYIGIPISKEFWQQLLFENIRNLILLCISSGFAVANLSSFIISPISVLLLIM